MTRSFRTSLSSKSSRPTKIRYLVVLILISQDNILQSFRFLTNQYTFRINSKQRSPFITSSSFPILIHLGGRLELYFSRLLRGSIHGTLLNILNYKRDTMFFILQSLAKWPSLLQLQQVITFLPLLSYFLPLNFPLSYF